jgi:hypothetical protein
LLMTSVVLMVALSRGTHPTVIAAH